MTSVDECVTCGHDRDQHDENGKCEISTIYPAINPTVPLYCTCRAFMSKPEQEPIEPWKTGQWTRIRYTEVKQEFLWPESAPRLIARTLHANLHDHLRPTVMGEEQWKSAAAAVLSALTPLVALTASERDLIVEALENEAERLDDAIDHGDWLEMGSEVRSRTAMEELAKRLKP